MRPLDRGTDTLRHVYFVLRSESPLGTTFHYLDFLAHYVRGVGNISLITAYVYVPDKEGKSLRTSQDYHPLAATVECAYHGLAFVAYNLSHATSMQFTQERVPIGADTPPHFLVNLIKSNLTNLCIMLVSIPLLPSAAGLDCSTRLTGNARSMCFDYPSCGRRVLDNQYYVVVCPLYPYVRILCFFILDVVRPTPPLAPVPSRLS
jgi:hypothetical protein